MTNSTPTSHVQELAALMPRLGLTDGTAAEDKALVAASVTLTKICNDIDDNKSVSATLGQTELPALLTQLLTPSRHSSAADNTGDSADATAAAAEDPYEYLLTVSVYVEYITLIVSGLLLVPANRDALFAAGFPQRIGEILAAVAKQPEDAWSAQVHDYRNLVSCFYRVVEADHAPTNAELAARRHYGPLLKLAATARKAGQWTGTTRGQVSWFLWKIVAKLAPLTTFHLDPKGLARVGAGFAFWNTAEPVPEPKLLSGDEKDGVAMTAAEREAELQYDLFALQAATRTLAEFTNAGRLAAACLTEGSGARKLASFMDAPAPPAWVGALDAQTTAGVRGLLARGRNAAGAAIVTLLELSDDVPAWIAPHIATWLQDEATLGTVLDINNSLDSAERAAPLLAPPSPLPETLATLLAATPAWKTQYVLLGLLRNLSLAATGESEHTRTVGEPILRGILSLPLWGDSDTPARELETMRRNALLVVDRLAADPALAAVLVAHPALENMYTYAVDNVNELASVILVHVTRAIARAPSANPTALQFITALLLRGSHDQTMLAAAVAAIGATASTPAKAALASALAEVPPTSSNGDASSSSGNLVLAHILAPTDTEDAPSASPEIEAATLAAVRDLSDGALTAAVRERVAANKAAGARVVAGAEAL